MVVENFKGSGQQAVCRADGSHRTNHVRRFDCRLDDREDGAVAGCTFFNKDPLGLLGAARILGLKPTTLEARMAKLGIERGPSPTNAPKATIRRAP